jgi:hypothetical protein
VIDRRKQNMGDRVSYETPIMSMDEFNIGSAGKRPDPWVDDPLR